MRLRKGKIFKTITVATDVAMLLVVVVGCIFLRHSVLNVNLDRNEFPVKGIDISHHNGKINFDAVKSDSVRFVIIKATDGVGDYDSCLVRNYTGAKNSGLDVGVYHYFRFHRDGHSQADYLLSTLDSFGVNVDLPIAIDIEHKNNSFYDVRTITRNIRDMVNDLRKAGYRAMIYVNLNEYSTFIQRDFKDVDLWLASSRFPNDTINQRILWQHSHQGRVTGVEGDVDLNTFNGTSDQYHQWVSIK